MMTKDEIDAFCEKCPDCGKRECCRINKCAECREVYSCMVKVCVLEHKGLHSPRQTLKGEEYERAEGKEIGRMTNPKIAARLRAYIAAGEADSTELMYEKLSRYEDTGLEPEEIKIRWERT